MKMPTAFRRHVLRALVPLLAACSSAGAESAPFASLEEIPTPAAPGSAQPNLAALGPTLLLSWLEPDGEGHALRFAAREAERWSEPRTIARGDDFFTNWADFPSVVALPGGMLAAHWLVRSGARSYDYDVHLSLSTDGGRTWSPPVVPHRDGTHSEHGFVSLFPAPGAVAAVWLDGRETAGTSGDHDGHASSGAMTLRYTTLTPSGELGTEVLLDDRTCECCQTAAALTARGPIVAYRDRSPEEVRDIYVVRQEENGWTAPRPVHTDGWRINGCPVNGPAIAAQELRVAVAWFTAAQEVPRVQIAFSDDAGATFGEPVRIDDGDPVGRVAVLVLSDGSALVSWLERVGEGAEVRARRVQSGRGAGAAFTVTASSAARASGFPRMQQVGEEVIFAWTDPAEPGAVRTAVARLRAF